MRCYWRGCFDQRGAGGGGAERPPPPSPNRAFAAPGSCPNCCCGASRACWAALDEQESAEDGRPAPCPTPRLPASSLPPTPTAALKRCIRPPPAGAASCSGPPTPALPSSRSMGAGGGSAVAMSVITRPQGSVKAEAGANEAGVAAPTGRPVTALHAAAGCSTASAPAQWLDCSCGSDCGNTQALPGDRKRSDDSCRCTLARALQHRTARSCVP